METIDEKTIKIDRQSYEPAYIQLVNILKDQISDGTYLPGAKIPSESELCKKYKVSPMTVRRSINTLIEGGFVNTIRGSGTYVRHPVLGEVSFGLDDIKGLLSDKERTKVKIIEAKIIKADEKLSRKLHVKKNENCILIRRILIHNGDPVIYHIEHLIYDPLSPIVEGEMEVTSLYGLFVGSGRTNFKRGDISIEAVILTKEEANFLNTIEMQPAFRLEHLFYDFRDKPVSWGEFVCRGDRMRFNTTVGIQMSS